MTDDQEPAPEPFELPEGLGPLELAQVFARIGRRLARHHDATAALQALTGLTVQLVPGARWVSVTRGRGEVFTTMAPTDPVATAADRLQYELGTGPCIDAATSETVFESGDLARDERWAGFGPRVARDLGIRSVLSTRLTTEGDEDLDAGLNVYGDRTGAFDERSRVVATLLAAHASVSVGLVVERDEARHLQAALRSNREIGVAMGVLMSRHGVTREQAFDLLRIASQNTNRKLHDIATEVADTGALELPGRDSAT